MKIKIIPINEIFIEFENIKSFEFHKDFLVLNSFDETDYWFPTSRINWFKVGPYNDK